MEVALGLSFHFNQSYWLESFTFYFLVGFLLFRDAFGFIGCLLVSLSVNLFQ